MSQNKDIFTFIESESIFTRFKRAVTEAAQEFSKDPKKFISDFFRDDPAQAKRKRYLRIGISSAVFCWLLGCIVYLGIYYWRPPQIAADPDQLQKIADLTALPPEILPPAPKPVVQKAGGGGGGGRREMTPPSKGKPPKASLTPPIVSPTTHPPKIENPSLPVVPTIQVQPDLVSKIDLPIPIGDPKGVPGPPSDGPGEGGGIGTGKGGAVGSGKGRGLGPGEGYNTGGGSPKIGGSDTLSINDPGLSKPVITAKPKPKYTEDARRDKIQGVVVLSIILRKDGTVGDIKVSRGLGYGLDEEAIRAAEQIRFNPGTKDGQAVNVRARLEYTFSLL